MQTELTSEVSKVLKWSFLKCGQLPKSSYLKYTSYVKIYKLYEWLQKNYNSSFKRKNDLLQNKFKNQIFSYDF